MGIRADKTIVNLHIVSSTPAKHAYALRSRADTQVCPYRSSLRALRSNASSFFTPCSLLPAPRALLSAICHPLSAMCSLHYLSLIKRSNESALVDLLNERGIDEQVGISLLCLRILEREHI